MSRVCRVQQAGLADENTPTYSTRAFAAAACRLLAQHDPELPLATFSNPETRHPNPEAVFLPTYPFHRSSGEEGSSGFQHLNSPSGVRPGDHLLSRSDMGARKPQRLVSHTRYVHYGANRNYGKLRNVPSQFKSHLFVGSLCKNSRRLCGAARHVVGCPGSTLNCPTGPAASEQLNRELFQKLASAPLHHKESIPWDTMMPVP
jgi:hypothetical protein